MISSNHPSSLVQSLSLQIVERDGHELLHTVALGKALQALTSLRSLSLEYDWDPVEIGYGSPELWDIAQAIVLMPELRYASNSHAVIQSINFVKCLGACALG